MLLKDDFYSYQDPGERIDYQITICSFLYQLPSEQKEILVLKYYYGYIEQEIGDKMHISRQAVNKQKNQALKKLKLFIIS